MRWTVIVKALRVLAVVGVVIATVASIWALRYLPRSGAAMLSVGLFGFVAIGSLLFVAVSRDPLDRVGIWRRRWSSVGSHPLAVVLATLSVVGTGWVASRMLETLPVAAVVFLATVSGVVASMADRLLPALMVLAVGLYGLTQVVGLDLTAHESVSVETAIVVGLILYAVAIVALLIAGAHFRWPMVIVGSLAAGYVWSGIAVLRFSPFSVTFQRVGVAGLLGAGIAAVLLWLVSRRLERGFDEVSDSEG